MNYYEGRVKATVENPSGTYLLVNLPAPALAIIRKRNCREVQIGIDDGRQISPLQRRKAYAMLRDISMHTGYTIEAAKEIMKTEHMLRMEADDVISLSDCSMTEAREFINTLMEYALKEGIILTESGLKRTDDIDMYLIQCIRYRRCCVCGRDAEIHHVDAIGMGNDRRRADDSDKRIVALCRTHHTIAHQKGWKSFSSDYMVYGIERRRADFMGVDDD